MFQFNPVSKQEYVESVNQSWHRSKVHDCVDGGLVYVNANDNILGATFPGKDGGMDFYIVADKTPG
jgi:hypothetical protein